MQTFVILRRGGWADSQELDVAANRSSRVGLDEMADQIRWIRSYVVQEQDGTLGTVCVYQGTDEEAVREHARRAGLPADEVIPVGDTVVVNEDPATASR